MGSTLRAINAFATSGWRTSKPDALCTASLARGASSQVVVHCPEHGGSRRCCLRRRQVWNGCAAGHREAGCVYQPKAKLRVAHGLPLYLCCKRHSRGTQPVLLCYGPTRTCGAGPKRGQPRVLSPPPSPRGRRMVWGCPAHQCPCPATTGPLAHISWVLCDRWTQGGQGIPMWIPSKDTLGPTLLKLQRCGCASQVVFCGLCVNSFSAEWKKRLSTSEKY